MKFEDLEVWKRSSRLCVLLYKHFRSINDYGFRDQICRSSLSIPSNIAEGAERGSAPDFIRFLHIAKGSAAELRTQAYIACRIKIISDKTQKELANELISMSKMIHGLIKSLKS